MNAFSSYLDEGEFLSLKFADLGIFKLKDIYRYLNFHFHKNDELNLPITNELISSLGY